MRISTNRSLAVLTIAFVLLIGGAERAFANYLGTNNRQPVVSAPQEQVKKFKGVVLKREPDSFTMSETTGGPATTVLFTSSTEVKSHKRGAFRGSKEYGESYVLRGLRLEVDGTRNPDGSITADKIRFDEQDLRTAQALKATLDPAEAEMNAKLKAEGGEFRVRYIVDDDEMKWLDTAGSFWLAGWTPGKHTLRFELIGPDGWPYKNGDGAIITREIIVRQ